VKRYISDIARGGGRTKTLAALLVVQSLAAVFFVGDVIWDLGMHGFDLHVLLEGLVATALVLGIVFGGIEMRRSLERVRRSEAALAAASGALGDLIEAQFEQWKLTPAEAEVALLALKGYDIAEISSLRDAATGTVRAQLTRVYSKADVSSRAQLVSVFIEELLGGPMKGMEEFGARQ
jgi:DNA-binding CsgD family transcriptional regulator